ncbi:GNAT family N-acetyltransferase [Mucilaginibacter sp. AW1-3]
MLHLLENPVWNGLISGNSHLANGTDEVKYFDKEVSPLIGMKDYSQADFDTLHQKINEDRTLATVTAFEVNIPPQWKLVRHIEILQMVFNGTLSPVIENPQFISLQKQHVPGMLALTKLTNPGPFAERTIEFGNYEGIFVDAELAAMAGQRTQPRPYIEVSAVCTHPDHHGNGYAGQLIRSQIRQIEAQLCIPFLHVRNDNDTAIRLYERLGFYINQKIHFNLIEKA